MKLKEGKRGMGGRKVRYIKDLGFLPCYGLDLNVPQSLKRSEAEILEGDWIMGALHSSVY